MKLRLIIFIVICSVFLSGSSYENVLENQIDTAKESGFENYIPAETKDLLDLIGLEDFDYGNLSSFSFLDIVELIFNSILNKIKEPFKAMLMIIAAAISCSVIQSFSDDFNHTGTVANLVCTIVSASIFLVPIKNIITYSIRIIEECSDFMLAFIPVYSSAVAAMGYVSSATGFRTLMLTAVTVISNISGKIIVPLICVYFAISISGAITDFDTGELSKTIKSFSVWILTAGMAVFSGIMGLGTLVSSSVDGNLSKTAKLLVGTFIPVIGSTVSDALSTVKSCLSVTKNLLGVYAIIIIAAIFIPPLISLISWRICLSVSSGIGSILENKSLSSILSSASFMVGIMIALVASTAIMFIFAVAIMLMTGGGT